MIHHYLKTTLRNVSNNRLSVLLNLTGMAISFSCIIAVMIYLQREFSFDRFHKHADSIYRVCFVYNRAESSSKSACITAAVAPSLQKEFPVIDLGCRISAPNTDQIVLPDGKNFTTEICYADSTFFEMFSFPLISGNPRTVLQKPHSAVVSSGIAKKIFNGQNPLGQIITMRDGTSLVITGVMEDIPQNSHIQCDVIISFSSLYRQKEVHLDWDGGNNYLNYVRFLQGSSPSSIQSGLNDFLEKQINYKIRQYGVSIALDFQPLPSIHLHSNDMYDPSSGNSVENLWLITAAGLLLLFIACMNYINISTGLAAKRVKEIGIRKTAGASDKAIISQFLTESLFICLISFLISLLLLEIFRPLFIVFFGDFSIREIFSVTMTPVIMVILVVTGIVAGSYPAFYLSRIQPAGIERVRIRQSIGGKYLRNTLLVFQFLIASVLISGTISIYRQVKFMQNTPTGFDYSNVLIIESPSQKADTKIIKSSLMQVPGVLMVASSSAFPGYGLTMNGYIPEGQSESVMIHLLETDTGYLSLLNIRVTEGRSFHGTGQDEMNSFIINRKLAELVNWKNPVGKYITRNGKHTVIGVVENFHFSTLHEPVEPLIISLQPVEQHDYISVKYNPSNRNGIVDEVESVWKSTIPDEPFIYYSYEEIINNLYFDDQKRNRGILILSALSIIIASLGLYGITLLIAEFGKKEIAIRKILGADTRSVRINVLWGILKWIVLANIISVPLAWWLISLWLEPYHYHIAISPDIFILSLSISLVMALFAVFLHLYKASRIEPLEVIRSE